MGASACLGGSVFAADAAKVTYDDHVRPVFENKCFSCHNPDKAKGGLDLTTYGAAMTGGSSGEIVVAGQPDDSRLYKSIAHLEEPEMPPEGDKLPQENIDLVAAWISGGLLENAGSTAKKAKKVQGLELAVPSTGRPDGPPPMPEHLVLEPEVATERAYSPADIASSPWAPLIALAAPKQVLLYNTDTWQLAGVLPFPEGFPQNLAFSRNGKILIAGGGRGGKMGRAVGWGVQSGQRVFEIGNEFDSVLAADLSADQSLVALGGPSRKVRIFDVQSGEEVAMIKKHTDWVTALSFSPDGVLLATGDRNGNLFVWEAATGNPFYTLKGHSKAITAISWRADSNVVASASEDGTVRLWEMNAGRQIKNWTAHGGGALDLAYTGDGRIVTCGRDKHAKVWDGNGGQKAASNDFAEFAVACCFTHDGAAFVVGDWTGAIKVFSSSDGKRIRELRANPPSIATQIASAGARVAEGRGAVEAAISAASAAEGAEAAALAALHEAEVALATQNTAKAKQSEALNTAETALARAGATIEAAADQNAAGVAQVETIADRIKAAAADAVALQGLEGELAEARAALEARDRRLESLEKERQAAAGSLANTRKQLSAEEAKLAPLQKAQSKAKSLVAEKQTASGKARAAVQAAELDLAGAIAGERFWHAAEINRQRYVKSLERPVLLERLELATREVGTAAEKSSAMAGQVDASRQSLAEAEARQDATQKQLTTLNAQLPDLEWEVKLAATLAAQKRATVEAIQKAMRDAPESLRPKIVAAIETANQELAQAESKHALAEGHFTQSVPKMEDELKKAKAAVAKARARLTEDLAAHEQATRQWQDLDLSKREAEHSLKSLDTEIAALRDRYLETLPPTS